MLAQGHTPTQPLLPGVARRNTACSQLIGMETLKLEPKVSTANLGLLRCGELVTEKGD